MSSSEIDPRRSGTLWVLNLDWPLPSDLSPRVPAAFTRIGPEAVLSLARAMACDDRAVLQRFGPGRRCYVAQIEGEIAAYSWVTFDEEQIGEMRMSIRLMPGEAYIWDCVTLPAFRRNRFYTALLAHITGELRAEGFCRAWIGTDFDNVPSQNGIALAGFWPVADLVVDRVVAMRLVWVRGRDGVPEHVVTDVRRALLGDRDRAWLSALPLAKHDQPMTDA